VSYISGLLFFDNLKVNYDNRTVLNELCLEISSNTIHGLVGLNGSGKTTLLNLFANLSKPDEGQISIPNDKIVGYLPQELVKAGNDSVYNEVLKAFEELNRMEQEIEELNQKLANLSIEEHHKHEQILHDLQHPAPRQSRVQDLILSQHEQRCL